VKERAFMFGSHRGLCGIVSEPDARSNPRRQAVVLSNVGMHNRIGPFRIWVELARRLAHQGFHVLRFDLSGMGDSDARPVSLADQELLELDMTEALSFVTAKYGIDRFILIGLCSGVPGAHALAARDKRVLGAAFIDGYTYRTTSYYLKRHFLRYFQPQLWVRYFRRRLAQGRRDSSELIDSPVAPPRFYSGAAPPRERFRSEISSMTERKIPLLFIYTGEVQDHFNGRRQFFQMLGPKIPRDRIALHYHAAADHLFQSLSERGDLIRRLSAWAGSIDRDLASQPRSNPSPVLLAADQ
jgi:pimeloyl-ACP methyl ester carboxylesterase